MKLTKNHIFLIILSIANIFCFAYYSTILFGNKNFPLATILSAIMFIIPFIASLVFTVLFFKKNSFNQKRYCGLTILQWSIAVVSVVCFAISVFFMVYSIIGINSMYESINGITNGYIYSDIYTKDQLLAFTKTNLARNFFSLFATILFALGCVWSSVSLFKKSRQ